MGARFWVKLEIELYCLYRESVCVSGMEVIHGENSLVVGVNYYLILFRWGLWLGILNAV